MGGSLMNFTTHLKTGLVIAAMALVSGSAKAQMADAVQGKSARLFALRAMARTASPRRPAFRISRGRIAYTLKGL
ncbi:hypothetical protein AUC68_06055 [Methyloceanibacter methanicus]|uniref:Uncharacterized protein n=1 Tax=Methyloceanibacter methanicus TaxID=1774968 RepID=A0A1E3VZ33_9HYPH|nr:hypothetical protein AUC68_06055 [Methyloceanibacter methanicus]